MNREVKILIKIAICDDEEYYRNRIGKLLDTYMREHDLDGVMDIFPSGKEFLKKRENIVRYDVVFMDINMDEMDGIETAMQMRKYHSDTCLVFVTAYMDYVLEGYKAEAVRYLMKDALDTSLAECMDAVLKKLQMKSKTFSFVEGSRKLYLDNILYVESSRHKSVFTYLSSEIVQYQIYEKLDVIEKRLEGCGFLRIHKSYLVNMRHIRKISNYTAVLDSGEEFPVPRLKFRTVKESFTAYKGEM